MSMDVLWGKLLDVWTTLDEDDRFEVLDHARWLAGDSRLVGGPLDGYRIPEEYKNYGAYLSIKFSDEQVAIYDRDDNMSYQFISLRPAGGEGYHCDFRS